MLIIWILGGVLVVFTVLSVIAIRRNKNESNKIDTDTKPGILPYMEEMIKKDRNYYRSLLLPCKKCKQNTYRIVNYHPSGYRITCTNCSYSTKEKDTLDDACFAWNQRNV